MKRKITELFTDFFESEKTGGLILITCTIISLVIANTNVGPVYISFWHQYLDGSFANIDLRLTNEHWINDGLMTIFFLLVGLEIERELFKGELSSARSAILPIMAAIGGMAIPAGIHFLFNNGTITQAGIGIPMATDIAFALGVLSLLGNRVPVAIKIFLTALAIIDDLGAVIIIAIFYTNDFSFSYFAGAIGIFLLLMIFNKTGIKNLWFYLIPGFAMWYFMLQSGVHATITGILLAFAIPFANDDEKNPSYKIQHWLHKPVAFLILPLFALANTGIILDNNSYKSLFTTNGLGIVLGLLIGKPVGIILFSYIAVKTKLSDIPQNMNWRLMFGAGLLAGIGFTMSIFITNLAFSDPAHVQESKISILFASLLAGALGYFFLKSSLPINNFEKK